MSVNIVNRVNQISYIDKLNYILKPFGFKTHLSRGDGGNTIYVVPIRGFPELLTVEHHEGNLELSVINNKGLNVAKLIQELWGKS